MQCPLILVRDENLYGTRTRYRSGTHRDTTDRHHQVYKHTNAPACSVLSDVACHEVMWRRSYKELTHRQMVPRVGLDKLLQQVMDRSGREQHLAPLPAFFLHFGRFPICTLSLASSRPTRSRFHFKLLCATWGYTWSSSQVENPSSFVVQP